MKNKFTVVIGYIVLFLWIWMGIELNQTQSHEVSRYIPVFGFMITLLLVLRLERSKKVESASQKSTNTRPNEA
jgi:hypothetical protein